MNLISKIKRRILSYNSSFQGVYEDWDSVYSRSHPSPWDECLTKVANATLAVKNGQAKYQRDSVIFNDSYLPTSLFYVLLSEALRKGNKITVLDFGGGLGGTYFHCKNLLPQLDVFKWVVVEQEEFVVKGKNQFETHELIFASSFNEVALHAIDVIIFSGVLHYLKNPFDVISDALALAPSTVFVDRLPYTLERLEDFWTLQVVPDEIFPSRVPMRVFGRHSIPEFFEQNRYVCHGRTDAVDPSAYVSGIKIDFSGYVFLKEVVR